VLENPGDPVPLGANLRKRAQNLYYPILFLHGIQDCCQHAVARKVADSPQNPNQSSEADFHTLVNKLAHICDYRPGGDTVTALTVLQADGVDGKILYAFVSNSRKRPNLIKTKDDLMSVLNILKENLEAKTKQSDEVLFDRLLRLVLRLNTVRIQRYLALLAKDLGSCIKACHGDPASDSEIRTRISPMSPCRTDELWQAEAAAKR
jgi:hypothetical protein